MHHISLTYELKLTLIP